MKGSLGTNSVNICYVTLPEDAKDCDKPSVSLFVCPFTYLKNHTAEVYQILFMFTVAVAWFGRLLAVL